MPKSKNKPKQVYRPIATLSLEERVEIYNDPVWIKRISNPDRSEEDTRKLRALINTFRKEGVIDSKYLFAVAQRAKRQSPHPRQAFLEEQTNKHLLDLLDLEIPLPQKIFTNEGTYLGFFISNDWIKKYIQKGGRFPKEAICHVVHTDGLELINLVLNQLKSDPDTQKTPCPIMFVYAAGTCDLKRISLIDDYAREIQEKPDPRFFINYLTNLRVKFLRNANDDPSEEPSFRDSFLKSFEFVCTRWSSGILKTNKVYIPEWLDDLRERCKTNTAKEFTETLPKKFSDEYLQGSVVDFFDYHGPIVFDGYWLDVPVKDVFNKVNQEERNQAIPLHTVYPERIDLLFYKEYALQMLNERLIEIGRKLAGTYDMLIPIKRKWFEDPCIYGFEPAGSKDAFVSSALSNFRLTEFYTKMALMMDLTQKFPLLDKMVKEPYRQATLREAPAFILKDICEHILVKYI